MDNNESPRSESRSSRLQLRPQRQPSKMRKMVQKVVVRVKIEENDSARGSKKHRSEGPPSDCWSWRKYGQKPIKGSPYPRGYYRCSTSKGCSAKKQVERSKTDASLLLITYTSSHNHPGPELPPTSYVEGDPGKECPQTPDPEQESINKEQKTSLNSDNMIIINKEALAHYESPSLVVDDYEPLCYPHLFTFSTPKSEEDEEPLCYPHLLNFSTSKSEENDFYDELEELPQTSSFTRNNFFEERILVNPY